LIIKSEARKDIHGYLSEFLKDKSFTDNLRRTTDAVTQILIDTQSEIKRCWLLDFMIWSTALVHDELLVIKVYVEAISLLRTIQYLKLNIQIMKYLGFCKGNAKIRTFLPKRTLEHKSSFDILSIHSNKDEGPAQNIN
jgi:hypothetical protein